MKDFINRNQRMLKYIGLGLFCLLVVVFRLRGVANLP